MPEKKKQHYVPQCLLKNFSNSNKKFYVFELLKNSIRDYPVPYNSHCYTDYFYGKDVTLENTISNIEAATAPILLKINEEKTISQNEELLIKNFILLQHMRTERAVDLNNNMIENVYSKLIPIIAQQEGLNIPPNMVRTYARQIVNNTNRSETAVQHVKFFKEHQDGLRDLKLIVLNSQQREFVSSDHPVVIENKYETHGGLGILCAGVIFIMPMSPQKCIMLYDDGIYDCATVSNNSYTLTSEEIKLLNNQQYLQARKLLYSKNITALQEVKQYFDSRYLDNQLRELLTWLGLKDFIYINLAIANLKKNNPSIIQQLNPKFFAKDEGDFLPFLTVKKEFIPFVGNLNAGFDRFTDINDIPYKYYYVGENYVNVMKEYLAKRK